MSRSGIFNLVSRDERFEALTRSDVLVRRLVEIRAKRAGRRDAVWAPTFADIAKTHQLYVREAYHPHVPITSEYVKVMPAGGKVTLDGATGGRTRVLEFDLPSTGHFTSDLVFHVKLPAIGTGSGATYYRWVAYPGLRLFREVAFTSRGTTVDSYDWEDAVSYGQTRIPPSRRPAWERMVGQEDTRVATYFNRNGWTGELAYREGLQTPKRAHPSTDLWVPLQFWMCDGVASALPSSMVPATERKVVVNLEALSKMIVASDGCDTAQDLDLSGVKVEVNLYANQLFTLPEVAEVFSERVNFSLIRVHRRQSLRITGNSGTMLLNELKWPIEYAVAGIRDEGNADDPDQWHLMGRPKTRARADRLTLPVTYYNGSEDQLVVRDAKETTALDPIATSLAFRVEDTVNIFDLMPATFYNSYLPGRYPRETGISAPTDPHLYLLPFCLWPGRREQTGSLDMGNVRRPALVYNASGVSSAAPAEIVVRATALNFLICRADEVKLQYAL